MLMQTPQVSFGSQLAEMTIGCRLTLRRFGVSRAMTTDQKALAAAAFDADPKRVSGSKRLLDRKNQQYQAVVKIMNRAESAWRFFTVDYPPVDGIRLINKDFVSILQQQIAKLQTELQAAAQSLSDVQDEIKLEAQKALAHLYNAADYPSDLGSQFAIELSFPSVQPDPRLEKIAPQLWEAERAKAKAHFDAAAATAAEALTQEFKDLLDHLVERLGNENGKPKSFRASTITNMQDFFDRFAMLNLGQNDQLSALVGTCKAIVGGTSAESLRENHGFRTTIHAGLASVKDKLDTLVVDAERSIIL